MIASITNTTLEWFPRLSSRQLILFRFLWTYVISNRSHVYFSKLVTEDLVLSHIAERGISYLGELCGTLSDIIPVECPHLLDDESECLPGTRQDNSNRTEDSAPTPYTPTLQNQRNTFVPREVFGPSWPGIPSQSYFRKYLQTRLEIQEGLLTTVCKSIHSCHL